MNYTIFDGLPLSDLQDFFNNFAQVPCANKITQAAQTGSYNILTHRQKYRKAPLVNEF